MEKLDRRVVRTRRMLRKALMELVLEKGYDDVTVQDIADRADLRRATFYLHYPDKGKLLLDALESIFDDLLADKPRPDAFRVMLEHAAANAKLYRALFAGQGAAVVMRRIRAFLADAILDSLRAADEAASPVPLEVVANYLAGAEVNLVVWWLEHDMPYSADEMARMAQRLALGGVQSIPGSQRGSF